MSLDAQLAISRFQSLVRTEAAQLKGDWIEGRFAAQPLVIHDPEVLCKLITNLPDSPAQILEFTRKYAPFVNVSMLDSDPATTKARSRNTFRFALSEWRAWQTTFRNDWKSVVAAPREWSRDEKVWTFPKGSRLFFSEGGNVLELENFLDLVKLCFGSLPWSRLRICPSPECQRPFFVAERSRETFCKSKLCKKWNERQRKLACWNRHKDRYLKNKIGE